MDFIKYCPICTGTYLESYRVCISSFLHERMFNHNSVQDCQFVRCERCDFYFFNIRPDESEMKRLYVGYRGDEYQKQRQKNEPGYTSQLNAMIGNNPVEIHNRVTALQEVLKRNNIPDSISVLDYGGNDGKLIPESISGKKYCFDLSDNITIEEVIKLDRDELALHNYDLIMLSHVLEHVSYPQEVMREVTSVMREGTHLYVELPYELENVKLMFRRNRTLVGVLKGFFKRNRPKWLFPSVSFGLGPGFHEHINYFNTASLKKLIYVGGLRCVDMGVKKVNLGWANVDILFFLEF